MSKCNYIYNKFNKYNVIYQGFKKNINGKSPIYSTLKLALNQLDETTDTLQIIAKSIVLLKSFICRNNLY